MNILKNLFKRKRPRTLADLDTLNVGDVDKILTEVNKPYNFQFVGKNIEPCYKCTSELFDIIEPKITMENRTLVECSECKEKRYIIL